MPNSFFRFRQFVVEQDRCAMKVTTDACILGAYAPVTNAVALLDIGTGTGLIALMCAQRSRAPIYAIEIDKDSASQAKENFEQSPWKRRLTIIHADINHFSPPFTFDCIVCNPPFYSGHRPAASKGRTGARHAVHLTTQQLLTAVKRLLHPSIGQFTVLLPAAFAHSFMNEAEGRHLFMQEQLLIRDQQHKKAHRSIMSFGPSPCARPLTKILTIKAPDGNYTAEFSALLQEYYL